MKLENLNPAKKNTHVTVNGKRYWIGHGGFIDDGNGNPVDVPESDSKKLTQGKAWRELSWDPNDPKYVARMTPVAPGIGIGRPVRSMNELNWDQGIRPKTTDEIEPQAVTIPTKDGNLSGEEQLEKRVPTDADIQKAIDEDKEAAKESGETTEQETGLLGDSGEDAGSADTTREIEALSGQNPKEEETEEWPDPDMNMHIDYLRNMAKAYQVKFNKRTNKKQLIKDIMSAMYTEE